MKDMPRAPRDIAPGTMLAIMLAACGSGVWIVTTFSPMLRMH